MAIRAILKQRQLADAQRNLAALQQHEAELRSQLDAIDPETGTVDAELEAQITASDEALARAETAITQLRSELEAIEAEQTAAAEMRSANPHTAERSMNHMNTERRALADALVRDNRIVIRNAHDFLERGIITTANTANPSAVAGINELVGPRYSSFIDMVDIQDCTGMGTLTVAYEDKEATAAKQAEGEESTGTIPEYKTVDLAPELITASGAISRQVKKQSPLLYLEKVEKAARAALRKALMDAATEKILASDLVASVTKSKVFTPTLLSEIILSYGGSEGVEGHSLLSLHKKDLEAFTKVQGANEFLPAYVFTPDDENPNTGYIKAQNGLGCRYSLNDKLTPLCEASSGAKTMFYGNPLCCAAGLWGDYEVTVDESIYRDKSLIGIFGEVLGAMGPAVKDGFVVVTAE